MAKCAVVGCTNKPVGGIEETIDASSFDYPNATLPGQTTAWCKEHRSTLEPKARGKRGRVLTAAELAQ